MQIIIASDVFGITPELKTAFAALHKQAIFLSPWQNNTYPHTTEAEAAANFLQCNGFETYSTKIAKIAADQPVFIIGLSVGATSAWLYACSQACHPKSHAFLFYGSRIRDYKNLYPQCTASLVFAENEPSFNVANLVSELVLRNIQATTISNTNHGFMNPLSSNYCATQAHIQIAHLNSAYTQITNCQKI